MGPTKKAKKRSKKSKCKTLWWEQNKKTRCDKQEIIPSASFETDSDPEKLVVHKEVIRKVKQYGRAKNAQSEIPVKEHGLTDSDECASVADHQLCFEAEMRNEILQGSRIVEINYFTQKLLNLQYQHAISCTCGRLEICSEHKYGLASYIMLTCTSCGKNFQVNTENPEHKEASSIEEFTTNVGAVWGTLAAGASYTQMSEIFSAMNMPTLSAQRFTKLEEKLGVIWELSLWKDMEEAGQKEKEYALVNGNICADGIPRVTVYLDGSWSKRSYGHNYDALSGMVGIIGKHTGELLFISVRNRFCCICVRAQSKGLEPRNHTCYRNWDGSAPAMEADMVVEGFSKSIEMHGVRYCKFIADGDSSTFAKIKEKVPYGNLVRKIECTNHALKNYGKHLHKIKADTKIKIEGRKLLTNEKIKKLTKRAKASIYENAKNTKNVAQLKEDLENGLLHVYNDHRQCRQENCNTIGDTSKDKVSELKRTGIYNHIKGSLDLLVRKAHLLIENENNNRAERLMNIVARFNMGKRTNLIQRGSYQRRVHLAGLRHNKKKEWAIDPWKMATGENPGYYYKLFMKKDKARDTHKYVKNVKVVGKQTKLNCDYGPQADQPEDCENIDDKCQAIIQELQVNQLDIPQIAEDTIGQFDSDLYLQFKEKRLTASHFGRVFKRKKTTPCHSIVKECLGKTYFSTEATKYGIAKEIVAIKRFEDEHNVHVQPTGIWIDSNYGFLGASPDGLIGNNAIIEVKCLYACSKYDEENVKDILLKNKNTCLHLRNGNIHLKKTHKYYYQIQGTLNVCQREKCYFIVYINDKLDLHVEEILRDRDLWKEMLPTLIKFYTECIAPEIVRNRIGRGKRCIDPPYILEEINKKSKK